MRTKMVQISERTWINPDNVCVVYKCFETGDVRVKTIECDAESVGWESNYDLKETMRMIENAKGY
jgi:hypothetical protein